MQGNAPDLTCPQDPPNLGTLDLILNRHIELRFAAATHRSMADDELVIINVPVGPAIRIPARTSARLVLETLRSHPRAGNGVLSNRNNVLVVTSEAFLQAADGPYLFEAAGEPCLIRI